ncbi:MAG TPA: RNA 2',3'-cyclic phosphodiesterase [Syntrophales bacterium]|nr:RNA 2',3'-cyclic phosphodiesterase [Syntrophales bacterium]
MNDKKSLRAFLAVDPPSNIYDEIVRIQERLKKAIKGDVRWVRPEGIHLTLKFFGWIYESDIANISQVVKDKAANMRPLSLHVRRLGVFPTATRPRVLWLGIDGDTEPLIRLQKEIDDGLLNYGFGKEDRPFKPHLTLSRIKDPKGITGLVEAMKKNEDYTAGSFTVDGLTLFKSDLKPTGAVYTKLVNFPFPE